MCFFDVELSSNCSFNQKFRIFVQNFFRTEQLKSPQIKRLKEAFFKFNIFTLQILKWLSMVDYRCQSFVCFFNLFFFQTIQLFFFYLVEVPRLWRFTHIKNVKKIAFNLVLKEQHFLKGNKPFQIEILIFKVLITICQYLGVLNQDSKSLRILKIYYFFKTKFFYLQMSERKNLLIHRVRKSSYIHLCFFNYFL